MSDKNRTNRKGSILALLLAALMAAGLSTLSGYCLDSVRQPAGLDGCAASETNEEPDANIAADAAAESGEDIENTRDVNLQPCQGDRTARINADEETADAAVKKNRETPSGPEETDRAGKAERKENAKFTDGTDNTDNTEEIKSTDHMGEVNGSDNKPGDGDAAYADISEEAAAEMSREEDVSDNDLPRSKPASSGAVFGKEWVP